MFIINNSQDEIINTSINNITNDNYLILDILIVFVIFCIIIFIIYFNDKENRYWCRKKIK